MLTQSVLLVTRSFLALGAALGMIIPTVAAPCCGCCTSGAVTDTKTPACCQARSQPDRKVCCRDNTECTGPECSCHVLPAIAIPPEMRHRVESPRPIDELPAANLAGVTSNDFAAVRLLSGDSSPHSLDRLRLHALLCVWLN